MILIKKWVRHFSTFNSVFIVLFSVFGFYYDFFLFALLFEPVSIGCSARRNYFWSETDKMQTIKNFLLLIFFVTLPLVKRLKMMKNYSRFVKGNKLHNNRKLIRWTTLISFFTVILLYKEQLNNNQYKYSVFCDRTKVTCGNW